MDEGEIAAILASLKRRSLNSALFNIAHAYARAGRFAWDAISSANDADFAAPAILCQSFAIELLLKFFLVIEHPSEETVDTLIAKGVDLKGHKYSELFDRLKDESRQKIVASFGAALGRSVHANEFRETLIALGDDPFVRWRYVYESSALRTLNKPLLDSVTDALGKAAQTERRRIAESPH